MKNIQFMNYTELFDEFKIILNMKYMSYILTNEAARKEFYRTYPRGTENIIQSNFLKQFFNKHFKDIDKEAYVFFTLKTLLEEVEPGVYSGVKEKCIIALRDSEYGYFDVDRRAKLPGSEIRLITASDLTGQVTKKQETESKRRVRELKEKMDLKSLFTIHSTAEMKEIYGLNENLVTLLTKLGIVETVAEFHQLSMKDRIRLLDTDDGSELNALIEANKSKLAENDLKSFYKRMPEYLERYPEYFDLDRILLIAAFRANQHLEKTKLTVEENEELTKFLQIARDVIRIKSLKIRGLSNNDGSMQGKCEYSYRDLTEACKRIAENGRYISTTLESMAKEDIVHDPHTICEMELELLKMLKFTQEELNMVSEYEDVFKYLVENDIVTENQMNRILSLANVPEKDFCELINEGKIDDASIEIYLKRNHIIGKNLYNTLDSKEKMTLEDKLNYYLDGRIELSFLEKMGEDDRREFRKIFTPHKLIELYKDSERESEYLRYAAAYREFVINSLAKNEKEMLGEVIIEATDGDIDEEDLVKFYEQHLISISTLESWSGPYLVTRLMREAKLRPADVKDICKNGNYDCVLQIMKDPEIPRKNKLAIFYTTFADDERTLTDEQRSLRDIAKEEALKSMKLTEARSISGKSRVGISKSERVGKKRNEYVSEPMNRWTLMRLIDEEYSYEMLDSGMMIFKLPNIKGGLIILEKMFKKEKPDYARATKVIHMTMEDFDRIKSDLIIEGDISPTAVESHPAMNEKFESVWHTAAWGERIAEIVGYDMDSRRTPENIADIDREIERIKKSRKLR